MPGPSAPVTKAPKTRQTGTSASRARESAVDRKRASEAELEESLYGRPDAEAMPPPATPPTKRARRNVEEDPSIPPTPTPERAKLMHQPVTPVKPLSKTKKRASTGRPVDETVASVPLVRPADPNVTNAPIATPKGTRHVAYSKSEPAPSYFPPARTDTAHLLSKACEHLCKMDPRMKVLIDAYPCPIFTPEALAEPIDPYKSLVSGILAQQVSGAAAASIRRKFVALFNEGIEDPALHNFPSPHQVVASSISALTPAGLSQRKAEYVYGLAEKFVSKELSAEMLVKASWEEVLEKLLAVRGLGVWSVEMFGVFALKRMDIFSTGDLGIQ